jgi:tRNA(fMet)-specific endonuclease VapC
MFLLDTDTCIDILRGVMPVVSKLAQQSPDDCRISVISVFELRTGALLSANPSSELRKVNVFAAALSVISFDDSAAKVAAEIRSTLRSTGNSIGPYDLLIGAEAIRSACTLVTSNLSEFGRIQGLPIESWR